MIGRPPRRSRRALAASLALAVLSSLLAVFAAASPAHADPGCVNGGAYVLFARGSGERLNDVRALSFQHYVMQALANEGVPSAWAELGNLDNHMGTDGRPDDPREYPAIRVDDWRHPPFGYFGSVSTGVDELVTHLNDRYSGDGPGGTGYCWHETLVLGGYSQGAQVIGDALRSGRLSQAARDHIGYVALYGDPRFNAVNGMILHRSYNVNFQSSWWWVRGDDAGYHYAFNVWPLIVRNDGILGAASPYVPEEFKGRFGSWCAAADFVCSSNGNTTVHSTAYDGYWIANSANEIATRRSSSTNRAEWLQ